MAEDAPTVDDAPEPGPRPNPLASDGRRGWIAAVVALVPQIALAIWANAAESDWGEEVHVWGFTLTLVIFYFCYLALTWWTFGRLDPASLRTTIAASNATGRRAHFERLTFTDATSWVLGGVGTALVVVAITLLDPSTRKSPLALGMAGLMVVLAWAVMQVSATLLLLRIDVAEPTLRFPDDGPHGLPDYAYAATQVLTTFATSDVAVTSTAGRRAVTTLSIASLVFNTVVVALLVSAFLGLTS